MDKKTAMQYYRKHSDYVLVCKTKLINTLSVECLLSTKKPKWSMMLFC